LKGEVRIEQLLEDDTLFEPGRYVILSFGQVQFREAAGRKTARETEIEYFRRQHGRCVLKLQGIDSISEAEKYIGSEVKIPVDELPVLKDGWFYTFQLKGCRVFTKSGEYIGTVVDVFGSSGNEVLNVDREGEETLIPFAQSFISNIDADAGRIEVDLPDDLRNLNK
jgi:16S rRNA processing protein RimM